MTISFNQLHKIKGLSAFNIDSAWRRKINQHSTRYGFIDGSILQINHTRREGVAYAPNGDRVSSHWLKINARGK